MVETGTGRVQRGRRRPFGAAVFGPVLALALALGLAGGAPPAAAQVAAGPQEPTAPRGGKAARPVQPAPEVPKSFLEAEAEAATSGDLYLVLAPGGDRLDLACQGVVLRSFDLRGARFAPPPRSSGPATWPAVAFQLSEGLAEPKRPEIAPPPPEGEGEPAPAPPPVTASGGIDFAAKQREEVLHRAPASYLLTFSPPLEVAVLGLTGAPGEESRGLGDRLEEGWVRLQRWLKGAGLPPRLTLELPEEEARRLFLELEPGTRLLVAPPPAEEETNSDQ